MPPAPAPPAFPPPPGLAGACLPLISSAHLSNSSPHALHRNTRPPLSKASFSLGFLFLTTRTLAQTGNGSAGISQATSLVSGYFDVATTLLYAIGAIVGLVGAVKVFNAWNACGAQYQ